MFIKTQLPAILNIIEHIFFQEKIVYDCFQPRIERLDLRQNQRGNVRHNAMQTNQRRIADRFEDRIEVFHACFFKNSGQSLGFVCRRTPRSTIWVTQIEKENDGFMAGDGIAFPRE